MIVLSLPTPPSANALFFNGRKGRVRTSDYEEWRVHAAWEIKTQKVQPIKGPVEILYEVERNNRRDLDNFLKPLNDALVNAGVIEADRMGIVGDVRIRVADGIEGVRATIIPL